MNYTVKSLHIYPIKSLQGIELSSVELTDTGFKYDRQWMLVDDNNTFITQRSYPKMARFKTAIVNDTLRVSMGGSSIDLDLNKQSESNIEVTIWLDTVQACLEDENINNWFSQQLDMPCKLVKLALNKKRSVDNTFAKNQETVGFADAFPLLVVAHNNIELLNSKLNEPAEMNRFRANIVIDGLAPHEEDKIQSIIINDININLVKPCDRCTVPSVNQQTGEKRPDILRALIKYRQFNKKIYFGMNGIHQQNGIIEKGHFVKVID